MGSKKYYQSKTFWVNVISAVAIAVQCQTGFVVSPSTQAIALGLINAGLRFTTKKPIVLS